MQVHRELGAGFLESVYQRSLAVQMREHRIPFEREVSLEVRYHGESVGMYRADFICHGAVIVELKAISSIGRAEVSQLAHYMRATNQSLGLLLNFGSTSLQYQRVVGPQVVPRRHELDAGEPDAAGICEIPTSR
jgi:GxxExxY protein